MKQTVVIVNAELPVKPKSRYDLGNSSLKARCGAGVVIDKNGAILTSEYLVPDNANAIRVRRGIDETFWEAKLMYRSRKHDLAIIVPKEKVDRFHFATFDTEDRFDVGKEVLSISHTGDFLYSLMIGHLACQDHRFFRDVWEEKEDVAPFSLSDDLKLMQINNFHSGENAMGAPVFSSSGKVIGLTSFVLKGYDFAVHSTVLKEFCGSYQEAIGKGKGKAEEE
ncbi:hypothetical protein Vadar_005116 [Vaccinium darrowii]|uniref:Uncharacterized protein n=1 Tax=Vaccinium darrowii TaxID=229202 RepID=A0ACB7ZI79_9ERIC|nr:hypothetical protein Vadar_005116 [Vaccinium darrowii]